MYVIYSDISQQRSDISRNMYCSITLWLGHLSDQTGIVQVNAESVWEMSDNIRLLYVGILSIQDYKVHWNSGG